MKRIIIFIGLLFLIFVSQKSQQAGSLTFADRQGKYWLDIQDDYDAVHSGGERADSNSRAADIKQEIILQEEPADTQQNNLSGKYYTNVFICL